MPNARINLYSTEVNKIDSICSQIVEIAKKVGVKYKGPINLPTKRLKVPVRRSPDGEGSETWERYEMRIHKRVVDISADERALHLIMRINIPKDVNIEIEVIE